MSKARQWGSSRTRSCPKAGCRTALEAKQKLGYDALGVMEKHLDGNHFFAGDRYSVADIALYAYTHVADEGGLDLNGFPAVLAWLERL
jgi:glutathione S-transferase